MGETLTAKDVYEQLTRFLEGKLRGAALAAWAFDQFCDQEEELLVYEANCADVITSVLDTLMWADSAPFALTIEAGQQLANQLVSCIDQAPETTS